ncbi:cell division ATP-binding protein FtsE [Candidatus Roizmanbacteria bacterium CG_4_9_14_0_2_um_filter_39_13]|uniref:Cell division ATP-binding protein FtsE n=1 Tax=Candidatus Roizmanbacteria bacterium CG_4_9_14_0_2_um_filter_39_13 TaxID=1974839 RepID=A0A2M8F1P7_9BACT|nr:MAG: cell division ATP-binding protein FtsE [Candidatus Roizmanbacteria bacterium CG_4_10_14_0_2_um_filter_39_12]PJC33212.1 MAG: cell division ATP-binding protein FtsE [Candidatus Roizmanbacteria bacterium CG_4_9_14_0_2_um_filter_39_13]
MISFQNVTVRYPLGNIALDSVSFDIEDGEFVYLVGPSGAGKTSILRLLLNDIHLSEGSITVDDFEITSQKFKKVTELRQKIGIVFQDFKILPESNIYENIALSMLVKGFDKSQITKEIDDALRLTDIEDKKYLFPAQLSAGELQRVAIARAVVGDRSIILADEPTGNLDPKTTWEIMKIFKQLEKKKTIIFATHNTDIVNSMKRRVIVIKKGKLIKDKKKGGYEL